MILMTEDLKHSRISVLIHAAAGILIALISPFLGRALYALGVMIIAAIFIGRGTERIVGKRGLTWWASNGLFVYVLVWLDMWIFMVNYF